MVFLQPEMRVGQQEGAHLRPAKVKSIGSPVDMVLIFIELFAVEAAQPELVTAKVAGHPVQNDPDARLVALLNEVHQVLGLAVPAGGGIVPCYLIAPGAVKRVLHHRHQLNVAVSHLLDIGHQLVGGFPVVIEGGHRHVLRVVPGHVVLLPGSKVYFIDIQRPLEMIRPRSAAHPSPVFPGIVLDIRHPGRGAWAHLRGESVRVRFVQQFAICRLDEVFIKSSHSQFREEAGPDAAATQTVQPVLPLLPAVHLTDHLHAFHAGGPYRKTDTHLPRHCYQVRS